MEKWLICGNSPHLPRDLSGRDLKSFNKVVRINNWKPIADVDNRVTDWVCYPLHHIGELEATYNVLDYDNGVKVWLAHPFALGAFQRIFSRDPDRMLTEAQRVKLCEQSGMIMPTTGMLAIYMAIYAPENPEIYTAGFDLFMTSKQHHYYDKKEKEPVESPHNHILDARQYKSLADWGVIKPLVRRF